MASHAEKTPEMQPEAMESESSEENRNKRKGSPLSKDETKKLSLLDTGKTGSLSKISSLPYIAKSAIAKEKGSKMAFSDMVRITFSDPTFAKSMVPIMHDMMSPLIQGTIKAAVNAANTNIKTTVMDPDG